MDNMKSMMKKHMKEHESTESKKHEGSESKKKEKSESATERAQKPSARHSNVHLRSSMTRRYKTA